VAEPYRLEVPLPAGAEAVVGVGDPVEAGDVVARDIRGGATVRVGVARALRRNRHDAGPLMLVRPGDRVRVDQPLARTPDREVRAPSNGIVLGYQASDGAARLLALEPGDPIRSDVRGVVVAVESGMVAIAVPAACVPGIGGTGPAVHGPLSILVSGPEAVLEPGSVGSDAAGRIIVGGSFASAETITRARAVGVAAIVVGGIHARELADFAGLQHRRSLLGTAAPPFSVLALDGFGRAGMDPARFAWLQARAGNEATVIGDRRLLLVAGADPPPARAARPAVGDRVVIVAGPGRGQAGLLEEVPPQPLATASGISALCGLVQLDRGRTVTVPLANLEASLPAG
jgi:hypothetical protein